MDQYCARRNATLVELLCERAAARPDHEIYTFLGKQGAATATWSWFELQQRACSIAACLQHEGRIADRALLIYPPGLEFIAAFLGCVLSGVVASPIAAPAPARLRQNADRIESMLADSGARFVLTHADLKAAAAPLAAEHQAFATAKWIATEELPLDAAALWKAPRIDATDLAVLQYTSGSTSRPKAVMVSHGNLMSNLALIKRAFRQDPQQRILSWLPHYHDMGLVGGILQPLYADATGFLMSPTTFLQNPKRWLDAISQLRITTSGAPNFAFDLCVERIAAEDKSKLDLSSWQVAFNGSEPVRAETLQRFADAFAASRFKREAFYPCYGLAEATLLISGAHHGEALHCKEVDADAMRAGRVSAPDQRASVSLLASGAVLDPVTVKIVDPVLGSVCPDNRIGEIWVSSAGVARGYWNRPDETAQTFAQQCEDTGSYLRTGDLGFLDGDLLFVTGRLKDLIIVRGANHYPQDLESTVQDVAVALRRGAGAAFAVDSTHGEAVVIVQELVPRHYATEKFSQLVDDIRDAIAARHGIQPAQILLVKAGQLPMTTSGKVRRQEARRLYLEGSFAAMHRWRAALPVASSSNAQAAGDQSILEYLREQCALRTAVPLQDIEEHRPIRLLGLDSLAAAEIMHAVQERYRRSVPLGAFFENLTLRQLADEITALPLDELAQDSHVESAAQASAQPLSVGQQALWFIQELWPQNPAYTLFFPCRLPASLDVDALQRALEAILEQHVLLRSTIVRGAQPRWSVHPSAAMPLQIEDALHLNESQLNQRLQSEAQTPFDLCAHPPIRIRLLRHTDGYTLLLSLHHIAADLWSMELLFGQLITAYANAIGGQTPLLETQSTDYAQFVSWQERMLRGSRGAQLQSYWRGIFADGVPATQLPLDRPRTSAATFNAGQIELHFDSELTRKLCGLCESRGVTLFTTLLSAFFVLLSRYTGNGTLLVGSPTHGRSLAGFRNVFGYFANLVGIRADLSDSLPLYELLQQVQTRVAGALMHCDYPFTELVKELQPARDLSPSSLVKVVFALQNARRLPSEVLAPLLLGQRADWLQTGEFRFQPLESPAKFTPFDLALQLVEDGDSMQGALRYSADLFDASTLQRMADQYRYLLQQIVASPHCTLAQLQILRPEEHHWLIKHCNDTHQEHPDAPITALIADRVRHAPHDIAVVDSLRQLTYQQLEHDANRVAHQLLKHSLTPEARVGIALPRGCEYIIAALAVLKAGGAYVPLDLNLPVQRLRYLIQDSGLRFIIAADALQCAPQNLVLQWSQLIDSESNEQAPVVSLQPDQLAYVIYTSGSTGMPKGVAVTHRALTNLVQWHGRRYEIQPQQRTTLLASVGFDASVWELWPHLAAGACAVWVPDEVRTSPEHLHAFLLQQQISLTFVPTVLAEALIRMPWQASALHTMLTGGDKLVTRPEQSLPFALINHYGPTETTVVASAGEVSAGTGLPDIGRPIANTQIYILDAHLQPTPIGVWGELYIGGTGVARGYLNRPGLTAQRFLADPFSPLPGARIYKSGDWARWQSNGCLEYRGRTDRQVKLRGFRIELGEIEAQLARHPKVGQVAVQLRETTTDKRLVGYVTHRGDIPTPEELRAFLKASLPEHMLPAAFVVLDQMPLTANGKLDSAALPAPAESIGTAAATPTEQLLAAVWQQLLGRHAVGREDDFFMLGGHSLLATQLVSRIRESFAVELPLRAVFESPTLTQLAHCIDHAQRGSMLAITTADRSQPLRLSHAQERLWFLDRLEPGKPVYNIPIALRIKGALDRDALQLAFARVIQRHEILRSRIGDSDGTAHLVVEHRPGHWEYESLAAMHADEREHVAIARADAEAVKPFDLARGPLMRVRLIQLHEEDALLLVTLHHIIADGGSVVVMFDEIAHLYDAFRNGLQAVEPDPRLQYADFAAWQRKWLAEERESIQTAYWLEQLRDYDDAFELPSDRPRPAVQSFNGDACSLDLDASIAQRVNGLCREHGVTAFMFLLAAFKLLLHRHSGRTDLAVGSPIGGRTKREFENLPGLFANTLILRSRLQTSASFIDLLRQIRATTLDAYSHQDIPFERIVELLQPRRSLARNPLFQVTFAVESAPRMPSFGGTLHISEQPARRTLAKFDQSWTVIQSAEGLRVAVEYNRDLFEASTLQRMADQYRYLLEQIVASPHCTLAQLQILRPEEHHWLIKHCNDTHQEHPDAPITALIADRVRHAPHDIAVVDSLRQLTYQQLEHDANRVAHQLLKHSLTPEARVGIALPRGCEYIIAALAVLKAGGAYVPLDLNLPVQRLRYLIQDSGLRFIIAADALQCAPQNLVLQWSQLIDSESNEQAPVVSLQPDQLAYVIYTSGSTGMPKGVAVTHRALTNLVQWHGRRYEIQPRQRITLLASVGFDASVWELWPHLAAGACAVWVPDEVRTSPEQLHTFLLQQQISLTFVPTVLAEALIRMPWQAGALRTMLTGGDKLVTRPEQSLPFALINHYGPTETTVVASAGEVSAGTGLPDIGRPIANTQIYILDAQLQPVPIGVWGELYIGGTGVARGYLNRPGLTAQRFLADPFSPLPGARIYKSGDWARWQSNGCLEYRGRTDRQVKLRGFRIELGEIEAQLARHPKVGQVAVQLRETTTDKRLVGYVTHRGDIPSTEELRAFLKASLPEHMLPAAFVVLDQMPLTANGKLDSAALPAPAESIGTAAATPTEQLLAGVWQQLLGRHTVGREDDFFMLGGHSLLATQLASRIRESFAVELPLRAVFESPTLAQLAHCIDHAQRGSMLAITIADRSQPLRLSHAQERLWFLDQLQPGSPLYHMAGAVDLAGRLNVDALAQSIHDLIERHEILRTTYAFHGGELRQMIRATPQFDLPTTDLRDSEEAIRKERLRYELRMEAARAFDLSVDLPLRLRLFRLDEEQHLLLFVLHHIAGDGWSMGVLTRDIAQLYQARLERRRPELPSLPVQYADFATWQRAWLQGPILESQLAYWRERFAQQVPHLQLRTDRPRPAIQTFAGATLPIRISNALTTQLRELGSAENATLFMTLMAGLQTLLHLHTRQDDIAIGTLIANRNRIETESLLGLFVNVLAIRCDLSGSPTFSAVLRQVRDATLDAYAHRDLPFEKLVEAVQPERDLSRTPIFQVMLVLQNVPNSAIRLPDLSIETRRLETGTAAHDFMITLAEEETGIAGTVDYNTDLFDAATIETLMSRYLLLLETAAQNPAEQLCRLSLLTADDRHRIVHAWNRTAVQLPLHLCFHQLFEAQVRRTPEAIAASDGSRQLSYAALNARANRFARGLRDQGVGSEQIVAAHAHRNLDLLVILLGTLKAGACYLPLDPSHPAQRIGQVIAQSRARMVVTSIADEHGMLATALADFAAPLQPRLMSIADVEAAAHSDADLNLRIDPQHLAYVIFTSGSTGLPKGAMIHQSGMLNHLFAKITDLRLTRVDVVAQLASQCFDISIWQLLSALLCGGSVHIFDEAIVLDPATLLAETARRQISILEVVPTLLRELLVELRQSEIPPVFPALRWLIATGEALPAASVRDWLNLYPRIPVMNAYGPTECSDDITHHVMTTSPLRDDVSVPIGKAVANTRLYILDPQMHPVPVGVSGQLYAGGAGVGRGYLHAARQTARVFIPDPFAEKTGARLYDTGDLARHLPDGSIEFLGRLDHQVKIRGFRIELPEIEAALLEHPSVRHCVVIAAQSPAEADRLVAYIESKDAAVAESTIAELREQLRGKLPHYMVPSAFVILPKIPLNASGKIDRKRLPAAQLSPSIAAAFVEPTGEVQRVIADIWRQVLGLDRLGSEDRFFDVGGDSLKAMKAYRLLENAFPGRLSMIDLFKYNNVKELGDYLAAGDGAGELDPAAVEAFEV